MTIYKNIKQNKYMDKKYDVSKIISSIYYDLVDLMGEDGIFAQLELELLLATIAAPITRLDFDSTPKEKMKKVMISVHNYMKTHHRWQNLTREALVRRFIYDWIPTLSRETMKQYVNEFRLFDGFDDEGFVVIVKDVYHIYYNNKKKLELENIPYQLVYGTMSDLQSSSQGLRWPEKKYDSTREYKSVEKEEGYWTVDHEITEDEWYRLLKERTSGKLRNVLMAYLDLPTHRASPINIEQWYGIDNHSVNACNTMLGRRAKIRMNIEIHDNQEKTRCWSVAMNKGRSEGENGFVWEMRPELCNAVERISKEQAWSPIKRIEI